MAKRYPRITIAALNLLVFLGVYAIKWHKPDAELWVLASLLVTNLSLMLASMINSAIWDESV